MTGPVAPVGVALAGFGTVGRAVVRSLCGGVHPSLRLRAICTRRVAAAKAAAPWVDPAVAWTDRFDDILTDGVQVVIEVAGGVEPARTWIARALDGGRSVVTANKQVMATHGPALVTLARDRRVALRFEAAVGGAVPVIRGVQEGLAADHITRITGILNGTSNFVLGRMERDGVTLQDAVTEAQAFGFAEADPSADLDGLDARAKLVILAAIGLCVYVPPDAVRAESIRDIQPEDFVHAASLGRAIRQVAWAARTDGAGGLAARVTPALVDARSWLARADGPRNVIVVRGQRSGDTVFAGQGAGGDATAVAVVSDALAIAHAATPPHRWPETTGSVADAGAGVHYVRLSPHARAGLPPDACFVGAGLGIQRVLKPACDGQGGWAALIGPCVTHAVDAVIGQWVRACPGGAAVVRLPVLDAD